MTKSNSQFDIYLLKFKSTCNFYAIHPKFKEMDEIAFTYIIIGILLHKKFQPIVAAMQPYQITSAFGDLFLPFLSLTFTTKVRRTADQMLSEST